MRSWPVFALLAVLGCESEKPGLAVHLQLDSPATIQSLTLKVTHLSGSFGPSKDSALAGGFILLGGDNGPELTIESQRKLSGTEDLLLQASDAAPIEVMVSAAAYDQAGNFLGRVKSAAVALDGTKRTSVSLHLTCANSGCTPAIDSQKLDVCESKPPKDVQTIAGIDSSWTLTPLAMLTFKGKPTLVFAENPRPEAFNPHQTLPNGRIYFVTANAATGAQSLVDSSVLEIDGEGPDFGYAAAVADVDGIGEDDLLVSDEIRGTVYVLTNAFLVNQTTGRFATRQIYLSELPDVQKITAPAGYKLGVVLAANISNSADGPDLVLGAQSDGSAGGHVYLVKPILPFQGSSIDLGAAPSVILTTLTGYSGGFPSRGNVIAGKLHSDQPPDQNYDDVFLSFPLLSAPSIAPPDGGAPGSNGVVFSLANAMLRSVHNIDITTLDPTSQPSPYGILYGPSGSTFGWDLAIGDLDADQVNELYVGARGANRVYVFEGDNAFQRATTGALAADLVLNGAPGSFFGTVVRAAYLSSQPAPGVGPHDLLIGAVNYAEAGKPAVGAVFELYASQIPRLGPSAQPIGVVPSTAALTILGCTENPRFEGVGNSILVDNYVVLGEAVANGGAGEAYAIYNTMH